jgi:hypothetical protein
LRTRAAPMVLCERLPRDPLVDANRRPNPWHLAYAFGPHFSARGQPSCPTPRAFLSATLVSPSARTASGRGDDPDRVSMPRLRQGVRVSPARRVDDHPHLRRHA